MGYFDTDILHERIATLQQELLEKHAKVHEALRLRDLANERVAELSQVLENLHARGGLGLDKHKWITDVLSKGGAE